MQQLAPGTKLNKKYRIIRTLGQGGFAFTYEAVQEPIHLRVCIKELSASGIKEGEVLATIKSPNVVRVLDYFEENENCYIVLEYLEGQTLFEYIKEKGCLSTQLLFTAANQLLNALSEIHSLGLIHRDIAPDNIMVMSGNTDEKEPFRLKLFDFGTARELGRSEYTCTLKDGYTPIEQLSSDEKQGAFTDLYALSGVLYFCLTGKKPESAYSRLLDDDLKKPSELGVQIEADLEKVLMKGLALQPEERYQSAGEMLNDMEKAMPKKKEEDRFPEGNTVHHKKRGILAAVCAMAAIVIAIAFAFFNKGSGTLQYDPESMYKVTLTPTDEFTVAGYNESIESLKERLNIFSKTSGSYSLEEDSGVITLLLNKTDFPQNEIIDNDYKSTSYEEEAIPEYILRAYLSRAGSLTLNQTGGDGTIPLEQIKDFSVSVKEDGEKIGLSVNRYFLIEFSEEFIEKNTSTIENWDNLYSVNQDSNCSPPVLPFATILKEDGSGFYLLPNDESDTLFEILQYNLTHAPLEHSFNIAIEEQTNWQSDAAEFGNSQVAEENISSDSVSYYIYGSMSEGEQMDCYQVLRNRLDAIGSSYALGQMDALSAVTSGCMAPAYTFIAIKGEDKLKYTDIADLALCANKFFLSTEDGQLSDEYSDYITSCYLGEDYISTSEYSYAEKMDGRAEKIYLMSVSGSYDQTTLLSGEIQDDGSFHFGAFANGDAIDEENRWVLKLISACIENQPPVTLSSYSIKTEENAQETLSQLGLFERK